MDYACGWWFENRAPDGYEIDKIGMINGMAWI